MNQKYNFYWEKLSTWKDPESIFTNLFSKKDQCFWLDSSKVTDGLSRFSYMGEASKVIYYTLDYSSEDIFSYLAQQLKKIKTEKTILPFDFNGGFVGYFGYELKKLLGFSSPYESDTPDSLWYFVDKFFVFDHKEKIIYLCTLAKSSENADVWFKKMRNIFMTKPSLGAKNNYQNNKPLFYFSRDKKQYLKDIDSCKKYLKNGESYEICLTNTITARIKVNSLDLYKTLRKNNPAPYSAYIKDKDFSILCSSPERFLKIDQKGWAESKPIKGTIKRSLNKAEDRKLAEKLRTSEKDKAENLMIVDLVRNDLGRVCEIDSIYVDKLMAIESYQTVHQMVSTIRGKLRVDMSVIDCIKSCFPGGSMTGAPKKRAVEIIDKLEKQARGIYSGALGYLSANGSVDLNIVIRTIISQEEKISIGMGGAILYSSDPESEYEEMVLKSKALVDATIKTIENS